MHGKLIIVAGFPASGKDTLINKLLETHPELKKIITYTDRPKRIGEEHGANYHFVTTSKFEELIQKDYFLEYVLTGSFYKGTSKSSFQPVLRGKNIVWQIDVTRAATIEETLQEKLGKQKSDAILSRTTKILVQSGSFEEALDRFQKRNPTSQLIEFHTRYEEEIKIYKANEDKFPIVLTNKNGEFDKALQELEKLI